jgi:DsbC/DsbD-like thiol-disulfide interchange protein
MSLGSPSSAKPQLVILLLLFACISTASAQRGAQHAKLSLITERTAIPAGSSEWIGLRFELEPGWHIYWTNPGDSGEPPKVTWHLPNGIQAGDLQFPAPQRIKDHSLVDYGYQGNVVLLSKLTVPSTDTSNQAEISADVRYLVCREVCVPAKEHLSLNLPEKAANSSADANLIQKTQEQLPQQVPSGRVRLSAVSTAHTFVIKVAGHHPDLGPISDFIPLDEQVIDNVSQPDIEAGKDAQMITLKKSEQLDHPVKELRGLLITHDQAYWATIPVTQLNKATSRKTNSQKDHSSKKS